jgi:hypothetical protein
VFCACCVCTVHHYMHPSSRRNHFQKHAAGFPLELGTWKHGRLPRGFRGFVALSPWIEFASEIRIPKFKLMLAVAVAVSTTGRTNLIVSALQYCILVPTLGPGSRALQPDPIWHAPRTTQVDDSTAHSLHGSTGFPVPSTPRGLPSYLVHTRASGPR